MNTLSMLCLALGLGMDAGAVCVGAAAAGFAGNRRAVFRLVFHFGLFQSLMLLLGWAGGTVIEHRLHTVNDWLAAGLLARIWHEESWRPPWKSL